jgi:hypothetical protein
LIHTVSYAVIKFVIDGTVTVSLLIVDRDCFIFLYCTEDQGSFCGAP